MKCNECGKSSQELIEVKNQKTGKWEMVCTDCIMEEI